MLDPIIADGFTMTKLVAAINRMPYKPGRLGQLGLFQESGVSTTSIMVDERQGRLSLVQTSERGAPVEQQKRAGVRTRTFGIRRVARSRNMMADEVQGVREFGSENRATPVLAKRDEHLAAMRADIEATIEWHRIGAIKGLIIDADNSTVLYDLFDEFDIEQQEVAFALADPDTELQAKIDELLEKIENELGETPWTGTRVLGGKLFWRALITHPKAKEAYLNSTLAASLRGDTREEFVYGGVTWERYRGGVGGVPFIGDDEAYAVPEGVPGLFITRFAPADYVETVNTIGLPLYAKSEPLAMGRGLAIEAQSNPISICTRPAACVKLTK